MDSRKRNISSVRIADTLAKIRTEQLWNTRLALCLYTNPLDHVSRIRTFQESWHVQPCQSLWTSRNNTELLLARNALTWSIAHKMARSLAVGTLYLSFDQRRKEQYNLLGCNSVQRGMKLISVENKLFDEHNLGQSSLLQSRPSNA
jgi:hypothetical protein